MRLMIVATLTVTKTKTLNGRLMKYNILLLSFFCGFIPKMMVMNASISKPITNQIKIQNMMVYIISILFTPLWCNQTYFLFIM